MNNNILICSFLYIICLGCTSKQQTSGDIVEIAVDKNYNDKQILLSDVADIAYIRLEAKNDSYLFQGYPIAITKNTIVIYSYNTGDFLFFTKDGKPKSVFNKKGNGPGEYLNIVNALYDEEKDELFAAGRNQIEVYSSTGEHKRTLFVPKEAWIYEITSFDENTLLLFDNNKRNSIYFKRFQQMSGRPNQDYEEENIPDIRKKYASSFVRISKVDGNVVEYIPIPENFNMELSAPFSMGEMTSMILGPTNRIVNYKEGFLLYNQETDSIFFYDKTTTLTPAFIRTPHVGTISPDIYINGMIQASNYQFFEFVTLKVVRPGYLQTDYLMQDEQDGVIYRQKIIFDEFVGKEIFLSPMNIIRTRSSKVGLLTLTLDELKEANRGNKLKGRLKSLVESMDEDENDIYVLLYFKQ